MTDVIRVDGIRGYGYHGVLADERATGQEFFVDVAIEVDLSRAGVSDELADTVDYSAVAARVLARIEGEPVDLIERLAHLVAGDVLADPRVEAVEVRVHKPRGSGRGACRRTSRSRSGANAASRSSSRSGPTSATRLATLTAAVAALAALPGVTVTAVSPLVESDPVGGLDQPAYLNAVLLARTTRPPEALLRDLHAVEAAHGRTREIHWGARTLDLDLIQFGRPGDDDECLREGPGLQVPHPRAAERAFVLVPWAQVDPHAMLRLGPHPSDPVVAVAQALARADARGVRPGPHWAPRW
ncbi:MAG: 2-amino-4-hydroxy-6-hydroxymethyldihydropteridine diphosphokinase [Dermatophilaceae bacterium]